MRSTLAFALVMMAAACGKSTGSGGGGGGGGGGPDANDLGAPAFSVQSSDITLQPGQEETYCWYFHTSNTSDVVINKWVSNDTPGSHHMILFTGGAEHADGLDTTNSCGLGTSGGVSNPPIWVYATQQETQEEDLPSDDGTGKPLGQKIAANTEAALQMHYLNSGDSTLVAHVHLDAYALPAGTDYTETDAYITYNNDISVPPNSMNTLVTASCALPSNVKFWEMTTHSHKQSVETKVFDGTGMLVDSTDWQHPTAMQWMTPQTFYTFTSSSLTWSCNYDNDAPPPYEPDGTSNADTTVVAGPSAATNEMCMAIGYFFPATGPFFGLNIKEAGGDTCLTEQF